MRELPDGWAWSTCGAVGTVQLGRQRSPKWHRGENMRPYLRVANVFEDRIDLSSVYEMDFPPEQFARFRLEPGDILLNEGQSPELVGRPAMYRGELPGACFTNSLIRFRPHSGIDAAFALYLFRHHLHTRRFMREARITTNIAHLSSTRFSSVEFPVPPLPEQRRIVAAIEDHFSRLDAADASLANAAKRAERLPDAACAALTSGEWPLTPLIDLLTSLRNGTFVSRPAANPPGLPIFRISAVRPRSLDSSDVRFADPPPKRAHKYMVEQGDLLFTRYSGNPKYVGACAVVPLAAAGVLHPDKLIRGVVDKRRADPRWISAFVSVSAGRESVEARLKTTAGQVGISGGQLKTVEISEPPLEEQRRRCDEIDRFTETANWSSSVIDSAILRSAALRRSILAAAFSGQLVAQDPFDEPASVLLERIAAERAGSKPSRKTSAKS